MICRVCGSEFLLHHLTTPEGVSWGRCVWCESQSSSLTYDDVAGEYGPQFAARLLHHREHGPIDLDGLRRDMTNNLERFRGLSGRFLDLGCAQGVSRSVIEGYGMEWHGFDVYPQDGIVSAPRFRADLFPVRFDAVMLREVIEHIPDWKELLAELNAATAPGAVLQIQTPRPTVHYDICVHERWHMQVFSSHALRAQLLSQGWIEYDRQEWSVGQLAMFRKSP